MTILEHMCYSRHRVELFGKAVMMLEESNGMELDLPPEYCHYRDGGCDLADSCLHCPFPRCVYEEYGGKQHWLKRSRDREIARLFNTEGKAIKELAQIFGVSQRTVQRALKGVQHE